MLVQLMRCMQRSPMSLTCPLLHPNTTSWLLSGQKPALCWKLQQSPTKWQLQQSPKTAQHKKCLRTHTTTNTPQAIVASKKVPDLSKPEAAHAQQLHQSPITHQGAAPPEPAGGATPGLDASEVGEPLLDGAAPWRGVDGWGLDVPRTEAMYSGGWIPTGELLNKSAQEIAIKPHRI